MQEVWPKHTTRHPVDDISIADTMRLLIDHGANITAQDETHSTPLHLAAFWCSVEAVRLLIECGADVTAHDGNHKTPLHLALLRVSVETIKPYIHHGLMLTDRTRIKKRDVIGTMSKTSFLQRCS